jgi:hypothetical protein
MDEEGSTSPIHHIAKWVVLAVGEYSRGRGPECARVPGRGSAPTVQIRTTNPDSNHDRKVTVPTV